MSGGLLGRSWDSINRDDPVAFALGDTSPPSPTLMMGELPRITSAPADDGNDDNDDDDDGDDDDDDWHDDGEKDGTAPFKLLEPLPPPELLTWFVSLVQCNKSEKTYLLV